MTTISARIEADSINKWSQRLTTFVLTYPRSIHSEVLTHRMLSKSSASSRAIPIEKLIQSVLDDPFVPLWWGKAQAGMQAYEEADEACKQFSERTWLLLRDDAVRSARMLAEAGLHKQVVNRLLEPWMHITVICSGTEWNNFFALRDHPAAEPHFQALAKAVRRALAESKPVRRRLVVDASDGMLLDAADLNSYHLPFVTEEERDNLRHKPVTEWFNLVRCSVARCARVSYLNHDKTAPSIDKDLELYHKLCTAVPLHATPAEHVAYPRRGRHGNFVGWRQHRLDLANHYVEG